MHTITSGSTWHFRIHTPVLLLAWCTLYLQKHLPSQKGNTCFNENRSACLKKQSLALSNTKRETWEEASMLWLQMDMMHRQKNPVPRELLLLWEHSVHVAPGYQGPLTVIQDNLAIFSSTEYLLLLLMRTSFTLKYFSKQTVCTFITNILMASEGLWLKWQIFYEHPYTEYLSGTLFYLSQKLNSSKSWMKHVFLKN